MASSFPGILKSAAEKSALDKNDNFFYVVMNRLVSMQCPQKSPKELMHELKEALKKALNKEEIATSEIDAIYNAAVLHGGSASNINDFIEVIAKELAIVRPVETKEDDTESKRKARETRAKNAAAARTENFRTAIKDEAVVQALSEMMGRIKPPAEKTKTAMQNEDGSVDISLTCRLQQTTGDSIEDAVRNIFFDIRKSRKDHGRADLVFGGKIIEIKYSRNMFSSLATDSQALYKNPEKWYLYIVGNAPIGQTSTLKAWFMRSDHLYEEISSVRGFGIDTSKDTALAEIEQQVNKLSSQLARAILNKSRPSRGTPDEQVTSMSLDKKVGINNVRFDIKFEGLLRSYIKEILRS